MADTNAKVRIKRDDTVVVTTGTQKGTVGRIVKVFPERGQVIVEGVRKVRRNQKKTRDQERGTVVEKELPIDISNVALWNAEEGRRVKVGYSVIDGKKVRVDRKSGAPIDN